MIKLDDNMHKELEMRNRSVDIVSDDGRIRGL
jgi:hypothetical protein